MGITVAGRYIQLRSEFYLKAKKSLKVTLCDLPLHSIGNEEVLHALNDVCHVISTVNYTNVWLNGKLTSIWNGDRFTYVDAQDIVKLPDTLPVGDHVAQIFKPVSMSTCKRCQGEGHCASDPNCPTRAPEHIQDMVEAFYGGQCELSNLHKCPLGCVIADKGTTFETSEHHYQFKKLKFHDKGVEAYEMLMEEDSFKAMKLAKKAVPDDEVSEEWKSTVRAEMHQSNQLKYQSCPHVKEKLLKSKLIITEVTGDSYWGTGLNVLQTLECLSNYWLGENVMGVILMEIHDKLQKVIEEQHDSEESLKCKAVSPLENTVKSTRT